MIAQRADFRVSPELETSLKSLRTTAGALGIVFLIITVIGYFVDAPQFFRSYLYSFVFWLGISIGCLNWLMVQYLSGGAWGVMSRRICESAAQAMPMWLILFIPLIFGIDALYGHS